MKVTLLSAGHCLSKEHHVFRDGQRRMMRFPATFVLLEHPTHGNMLLDTGYGFSFFRETSRWPYKLYRRITPTFLAKEELAVNQLKALGVKAEEIRFVLISHFHADHLGGLGDFPNATFVASEEALAWIRGLKGLNALAKGFLPGMMPAEFGGRAISIEEIGTDKLHPCPGFERGWDLWNDGSMLLLPLPGHAPGQMGLRVVDETGQAWFFVVDAAWHKRTIEERVLPGTAARFIIHDWKAYAESIDRIRTAASAEPTLRIVPCHCEETFLKWGKGVYRPAQMTM